MAFTDIVLAWQLEDLPYRESGETVYYDPDELVEAASAAFAFGCALGLDFPGRLPLILEQTHPGEGEAIVAECAGPLRELAAEARESAEEVGAELFLSSLFEALDDAEPVEAATGYNVISIGFEYGCILAHVERRAAMLVRNSFNRELAAVAQAQRASGPARFQSLQELAREMLLDYEREVGFGAAS